MSDPEMQNIPVPCTPLGDKLCTLYRRRRFLVPPLDYSQFEMRVLTQADSGFVTSDGKCAACARCGGLVCSCGVRGTQ